MTSRVVLIQLPKLKGSYFGTDIEIPIISGLRISKNLEAGEITMNSTRLRREAKRNANAVSTNEEPDN